MAVPPIYPEQMRCIQIYLDALTKADEQIIELELGRYASAVFRNPLVITDEDQDFVLGRLVDQGDGIWVFEPGEAP